MSEIIKWWKNKWAIMLVLTLVLTVVIGFILAYFISWGWILSLIIAVGGGIAGSYIIMKMLNVHT